MGIDYAVGLGISRKLSSDCPPGTSTYACAWNEKIVFSFLARFLISN